MAFLPQEIIRRKRDGETLSRNEVAFWVKGLSDESIGPEQVAAFAMAVYFQGLSREECAALTLAMRDSGTVLKWEEFDLDGPVVDKHSTGGVGDLVSLVLGPLLAACGAFVPMISGRGLGHTGGTLDKLESIPGYQTAPSIEKFQETVRNTGVAIIGQTENLAPADARLYAIRDVTSTVESISLITASILSKKLAAGLGALVMDVKVGNGAFMPSGEAARELASQIAEVGTEAGTPTTALLTDMNQCLARSAGNAVEVREAVAFLCDKTMRTPRLAAVTMALGSEILQTSGLARDAEEAEQKIQTALDSGRGAETFGRMIRALGGPSDFMENPDRHLPDAPVTRPVFPDREGVVQQVDARRLGLVVVELGGGRTKPDQTVDHAVGLTEVTGPGDVVGSARPLATVHARSDDEAQRTVQALRAAYKIGDEAPTPPPVIYERVRPGR